MTDQERALAREIAAGFREARSMLPDQRRRYTFEELQAALQPMRRMLTRLLERAREGLGDEAAAAISDTIEDIDQTIEAMRPGSGQE